jgi:hypothetical protein
MSRSGYSDDCDNVQLWRRAVERAATGFRGRAFLRRLRDALDAMPTKRLIADVIKDESGDVCALGVLDPNAPSYDAYDLSDHFGIARALAAEIVYMNDEYVQSRPFVKVGAEWVRRPAETPEERWIRMRKWVQEQLELPPAYAAVDPDAGTTTD